MAVVSSAVWFLCLQTPNYQTEATASLFIQMCEKYVTLSILMGLALKAWAENGQPVGQLNITPDMLTHLAGWMGRGEGDSEAA